MRAQGKPIIFVTIFGSYQIGKSTTIQKLTGDNTIAIGDGSNEETTGAFIYGPYSYQNLRLKFKMGKTEKNDETQIFFIDTEGCNGFEMGNSNPEASSYLLGQLIAPYAAISHLVIAMTTPNISSHEVNTYKKIINIVDSITQGTKIFDKNRLITLVRDVSKYKPSEGNFDQIQNYVTNYFFDKFGKNFQHNKVIPLPQYDINNKNEDIAKEFEHGFNIFSGKLFEHIETIRKNITFDAEGYCNIFEQLVRKIESKNLDIIANQILNNEIQKSEERNMTPIIEDIIRKKFEAINSLMKEYEDQLRNEQIVSALFIDLNNVSQELIYEIEKKLPHIQQMDIFKKYKRYIHEEIPKKYTVFEGLHKKIKEKQLNFLKNKVNDVIKKGENDIIEDINDGYTDELASSIGQIEAKCNRTVRGVFNSIDIYGDIQNEINQYIEKQIEKLNKRIFKLV
ncbi:hypothetical protein GPJ56_002352 [Histomonas meleagridis]|uniref:uncharacterized protein n=1 Tax=Histomonas meleagridis TaxID=135588 RepID=UPI0035594F59|nr:hypothetical protein GPJ56_002352 [Histomonas meleagridis]KAH0804611.1 hypothetical protein GO595_003441 [Histomonas meleagridis]